MRLAEPKRSPEPKRATLSVAEAARRLGISRNLAYELANSGELPGAFRLGRRRWLVSREALETYLKDPGQSGTAPLRLRQSA